jgi:histidinol-phosphate aminotransferase
MSFINRWLRTDIQTLDAYSIPSSKGYLKLDAMESPFLLSDELSELTDTYLNALKQAKINRYPDPCAKQLNQTLRQLMDIPNELSLLLGNGSDELIQLLALACQAGETILSLEPSFVMYSMIAKFTHLNYVGVALDENFELDESATLKAIKQHCPKIIFIAYPNNPTGNTFNRKAIINIIQTSNALVVLDEAYYAYAQDSFLTDIKHYPNLIVLRTISKIGFAGLRLGLLIAEPATINELNKLRLPYNINTLTQVSAHFLLKKRDKIEKNAVKILKSREQLSKQLNEISGIQAYPSQANFILFKADNALALFQHLKNNKLLIKNLSHTPKLANCLRVSIGNDFENQQFITLVEQFYDY